MTTIKSTWWSVTAFGEEISLLESNVFPEFVAKVYGGREECPSTGRLHFQGAIQCRRQVRMSQFKEWLPKAHLEPARDRLMLRKYAMKQDTAVGDKVERENSVACVSLEGCMRKLAQFWWEDDYKALCRHPAYEGKRKEAFKTLYWRVVSSILRECPEFRPVCHLFARADVIALWQNTREVWLEVEGGISITPPTTGFAEPGEQISNQVVYDEEA